MKISKIISGGQTGADRAGLDVAIELGIPHGGFVPKGRRSEDGVIPSIYNLTELATYDYPSRTKRNIEEADATILLTINGLTGGSKLTKSLALQSNKPLLHLDLDRLGKHVAAQTLREFLVTFKPTVINIAGSRESKQPGFSDVVREILRLALRP
jgi:hypothetical protein